MRNWTKSSNHCSAVITKNYSTSFYSAIKILQKDIQQPILSIYGFVRVADEVVDTFHKYNKEELLLEFEKDCYLSIERGISLNPILHSFQQVVNRYNIEKELIDSFLKSMKMDLIKNSYNNQSYKDYIIGSAEVVGLMCLKVFVNGDSAKYEQLKPYAMKLGSAFQKINFLRDIKNDYSDLGRSYFPGIDINLLDKRTKSEIEKDIQLDFDDAYKGILLLPKSCRLGVFIAYNYYIELFNRIKVLSPQQLLSKRWRVSNRKKASIIVSSTLRHKLNLL